MSLYEICLEIARVENGLAYGDIAYSYDKLMCAMGAAHPADVLDDIFCDVGNELFFDHDKKIPAARLRKMLKELKEFAEAYHISEINQPISKLEKYIAGMK